MAARQRRAWTLEEDRQLIEAVQIEGLKTHRPLNWCNISRKVPNRSNKDCRKRWMSTHAGAETKITKGAWSEAEDDQLRAAVQVVGPRWCRVAEMVQGRNSDQCAKRWKDTLDPAIDRSKWSPREDELLLKVVGQTGRKWARVVKEHFPGRTGLAAKNRYNCLMNQSRFPHPQEVYYPTSGISSPTEEWSPLSTSSASSVNSSSPITPLSPVSPISPLSPPYASGSEFPISTLYTSELDLNLTSMVHDGLDPISLMHLNDALFDFQSLAPGQCLVGSGFETPPQEELHTHVVKLYGSPRCCSTARIATVLYEKQIKYELYPLHATDSDAQPYIADDGVILHGCRNVCQYIATRYPDRGTKLTSNSDDTSAMEMFEQAKLTEIQSFEPLAKNALYETLMQRQHGLLPSDAVRGYALQELSNVIEGYESILSHQKYLAGEEISLVDLYHLPYGEMLSNVGIDLLLTKGPNVNRWWKDISSRPSWLAIRNGVPSKC